MLTTGVFTTHYYEIPFDEYGEPIYLIPFGDIHRSSPLCAEEHWLEFCEWAKGKKRCYFLGMGDYDDLASTSERVLLTNKGLHEATRESLENLYRKFTDRLAKEISFMKGKTIGLIEGNHFGEFQNGTTTTQRLCEALDSKYLGVSSFIRLSFVNTSRRKARLSCDIWAHHGVGGSGLLGGSMNKVQRMSQISDCDIALMGHDHQKSVGFDQRFSLVPCKEGVKLKSRKVLMGRTGSFLKGYEDGKQSYVADRCLNPTDIGTLKIELTPRRSYAGGTDESHLDIHASI